MRNVGMEGLQMVVSIKEGDPCVSARTGREPVIGKNSIELTPEESDPEIGIDEYAKRQLLVLPLINCRS